jgi:uncharacterized protein (DUF1015 family)
MAALHPFRALRPAPEAAARVAAVPYDVLDTEEARALAHENPLSFLHVSRAEIDLPPDTDPYSEAVYAQAVRNFTALKRQAPLVTEEAASVYVYRLGMGTHTQTGVAACYSLDEYDRGVIRKHERTRPDKEDDRTRHMLALRAQTGPVLLTYRASSIVDALVARATAGASPLFAFTAADGVDHSVWRVEQRDAHDLIPAFDAVPALYIADGHHRAASAARARRQLRARAGEGGEADTFLAVAFPHDQMRILPYNRVVKDLGARTPDALLAKLQERLTVADGPATPHRHGDVAMFLGGRWHTLRFGDAPAGLAAVDRLDVSRLQDAVLAPLLGIEDVRSDTRIDFVAGARGTGALEALVLSGRAAVAFSMYPPSVEDLMAIADAGGIMPPKSTWFEPKLRDGLLSHVL